LLVLLAAALPPLWALLVPYPIHGGVLLRHCGESSLAFQIKNQTAETRRVPSHWWLIPHHLVVSSLSSFIHLEFDSLLAFGILLLQVPFCQIVLLNLPLKGPPTPRFYEPAWVCSKKDDALTLEVDFRYRSQVSE
jgi:hypothetical protein